MSEQAIEIINLLSSISGIILGPLGILLAILAFIQAAFYYSKSKDTEAELKKQLAVMANQNDMIKEITNNMLSGTIQTISSIALAPTKGPASNINLENIQDTLKRTKNYTEGQGQPTSGEAGIQEHGLPNLPELITKDILQTEAISAVGQIFVYSGLTNIYAQYLLPPTSELGARMAENQNVLQHIEIVNLTHRTCNEAYAWLKNVKDSLSVVLDKHAMLPTILVYEKMFNDQLRNAQSTMEYWENLKREK